VPYQVNRKDCFLFAPVRTSALKRHIMVFVNFDVIIILYGRYFLEAEYFYIGILPSSALCTAYILMPQHRGYIVPVALHDAPLIKHTSRIYSCVVSVNIDNKIQVTHEQGSCRTLRSLLQTSV